ncbi:hypothetical protein NSP_32290 [Nodularia spumigena CCY9414]|nr:hypothetical protein NSP_32290 [Nodularia spumigena CCY9414]
MRVSLWSIAISVMIRLTPGENFLLETQGQKTGRGAGGTWLLYTPSC